MLLFARCLFFYYPDMKYTFEKRFYEVDILLKSTIEVDDKLKLIDQNNNMEIDCSEDQYFEITDNYIYFYNEKK